MKRKKLEIKNLSVEFSTLRGILPIVKNVSFTLYEGTTHTLVGNSGSGKSVFAMAIMRILANNGRISGGEILYYHYEDKEQEHPSRIESLTTYGIDSIEMQQIRINRISMIFQEPMSALSPVHRCGDIIGEAVKLKWPGLSKSQVKERVLKILEQLAIPDPLKTYRQYAFHLSGGMRQRICIALAIVCQPEILIADEPTTALDVTTQRKILILLDRIKREYGLTILFITHDMGIAAQISNSITVMQNGVFIEQKEPEELFENPQHPYSRQLIYASRIFEKRAVSKSVCRQNNRKKEMPVLTIRDLNMTFSNRSRGFFHEKLQYHQALDNISFNLNREETLGIVGESGSGKTTIARCITGLYRNFGGTILFNDRGLGINLGKHKYCRADPIYRQIRMVFQDPYFSLNPRLNIYNNIGEAMFIYGKSKLEIKKRVAELLIKVGLEPAMMERYPHAFSGGQRQRICIARAVIMNPTILIADEATSSLDVSLRSQVLDLLIGLQQEMHFSILLITHDISAVKYCADRMIVMHQGKIVEHGPVEEVINNSQANYTKKLMAAVPLADPHRRNLLNL